MMQKLKSFLLDDAVFYALLVVSIAIVAFLLGRNSMSQSHPQPAGVLVSQQAPLVVRESEQRVRVSEDGDTGVIASRSGTKYHLPTCPGAKQIKESNKISFSSIEQAKAAGYSAAANCDGLE